MQQKAKNFKGFRHELVQEFKGRIYMRIIITTVKLFLTCMTEIVEDLTGNDFQTISDEELDEAIQSFSLADRQRLGQSMFCYVWAILTHPTTKLVSSCATMLNFDQNVRLSLEIFVLQNLYVDYWCSKWQDPMWAKDEQGGPLHRLYILVQKDRDEVDRRLVSHSCFFLNLFD